MRTRLNTKLLGWLFGSCLLLAVGMHFLHASQIKRNAGGLLRQAERAEAKGRPDRMVSYLGRYLALRPDDREALAKFGVSLSKLSRTPRESQQAIETLERVLAGAPEKHDLRREVVRLSLGRGQYDVARRHLEILVLAKPEDGELEYLLGGCHEVAGDYAAAASWYEKSIKHAPHHLPSYVQLAGLLRDRLDQPREGSEMLDRMVAANAKAAGAYEARSSYRTETGLLVEAARDLAKARELAPGRADVELHAADLAVGRGQAEEARAHLELGITRDSSDVRLYWTLARLENGLGRSVEALAAWRRGLRIVPDNPDLIQGLMETLLARGETEEARTLLSRVQRAAAAPTLLHSLIASLRMEEGQWDEALRHLETALAADIRGGTWRAQLEMKMGRCFEQLGDDRKQLDACRRAVAAAPLLPQARLALAQLLLRQGKVESALAEFRQATAFPDAPAAAWLSLAQAELSQQGRPDTSPHDWTAFESALASAVALGGETLPVVLLRAEALYARGRQDEARAYLAGLRASYGSDLSWWLARIELAEKTGRTADGKQLWREAQQVLPDSINLRLARLNCWMRWEPSSSGGFMSELAGHLERLSTDDRARLLQALAETSWTRNDLVRAGDFARRLAEMRPTDLPCRLMLFDLALQRGSSDDQILALAEIRRVEGEQGPLGDYAQAAVLVRRAKQGERIDLAEARALLLEVLQARPSWARAYVMRAEVAMLEGKVDQALASWRTALDLGERRPETIARVAKLLVASNRWLEADQTIRRFPDSRAMPGDLALLAADIALRIGDRDRALKLARQAVPATSRNHRDQIWLSKLLHQVGRDAEALAVLEHLVQNSSAIPEVWPALVEFLVGTNQRQRAWAVLADAQRLLPIEQAPQALARCYELLGQQRQAAALHALAVAAQPEDFMVLAEAAGFHLRQHEEEMSLSYLKRLLDPRLECPPGRVAWTRRQIALLWAKNSQEAAFDAAIALLEQNRAEFGVNSEDQRTRALVLATRTPHRHEAIQLLEAVGHKESLRAEEQFRLAQLYDDLGERTKANEKMISLLALEGTNPEYLAYHVAALARSGEPEEARIWLARLERIEPTAKRTVDLKSTLIRPENQ